MKTTIHQYLVGYKQSKQGEDISCVWGKDNDKKAQWATPLTLNQAEWMRKRMPAKGAVIYKLVLLK